MRRSRYIDHHHQDDSDDEWICGGKYVPPQPTRRPTPAPNSPSASALWDLMSPAPLPTPIPDVNNEMNGGNAIDTNANATPANNCNAKSNKYGLLLAKTPVTERLQRLWRLIPDTVAKDHSGRKNHMVVENQVCSSSSRNCDTRDDVNANASSPTSNGTNLTSSNVKSSPVISRTKSNASQISNARDATPTHNYQNDSISKNGNDAQETSSRSRLAQMTDVTYKLSTKLSTSTASMRECTGPFHQTIVHVVDLTLPFLFWLIKTCLAFVIMTVGSLMLWIFALAFGRDRMLTLAEENLHVHNEVRSGGGRETREGHGSSADGRKGNDESAGMRFLRESIARSPFLKREKSRVVGTVSDTSSPSLSKSLGTINGTESLITRGNNAVASPELPAPSNRNHSESAISSTAAGTAKSTTTPSLSAIRNRNSSTSVKSTPHPAKADLMINGSKHTPQTATTRRVLFSEKNGKVSTEQFHYDKNLPASARKVGKDAHQRVVDDKENRVGTVNVARGVGPTSLSHKFDASSRKRDDTAATWNEKPSRSGNARSSALATSTDDSILRPSTYSGRKNESANCTPEGECNITADQRQQVAPLTSAQRRERQEQNERRKQQYIRTHGLDPAITPLSRRYGRLKRQQISKPLALTDGLSSRNNANNGNDASSKSSKLTSMDDALKRKRKDLLGAASRLGRQSRARMSGISAVPIRVLGRSQTPLKRRRDNTDDYAAEWVWRAMNDDGKTEIGFGNAKKGKFSGGSSDHFTSKASLFTPSKSPTPPVTTPPKNGTTSAAFAFGNSTPTPKKTVDGPASKAAVNETPAKPASSFSFGPTTSTPTKPVGSENAQANSATSNNAGAATVSSTFPFAGNKSKDNAPSFSFGTDSKTSATSAPTGSFGGSAPAAAPSKESETKPNNPTTAPAPSGGAGFAYSEGASSSVPPVADNKPPAAAIAFGITTAPATTVAPAITGSTFGASYGAETLPSTAKAPAPSASTFSFGSTTTSAPAPASTSSSAAGFSFGTNVDASSIMGNGSSVVDTANGTVPPASVPTPATTSFSFTATASSNPTPAAAGFTFGSNRGAASAPAPANAAPGFAFGNATAPSVATGGASTGTASTFSFGADGGVTMAVPNFGIPSGGGGVASSGGASARRRAQKAIGRRK
ncbi:hypothetical protein ACHAXS_011730 [Conticribra weissflogii]